MVTPVRNYFKIGVAQYVDVFFSLYPIDCVIIIFV